MKYIIDVEKIKGTDLWKAKEFNALVFDKNGLDRLTILDKDKQQSEIDILNRELDDKDFRVCQLQNLVNEKSRKILEMNEKILEYERMLFKEENVLISVKDKKALEDKVESQQREIDLLVKTHNKLRDEKTELRLENEKLSFELKTEKKGQGFYTLNMELQEEEIDKLKKEYEELKKYNSHLEKEWKDWDKICYKLKIENEDLKVELKEHKAVCNVAFEDIEGLKNENKSLVEQNSALEDEVVDFEVICTKLHNEKAELLKMYEEKCLEVESLLDTGKLPSNSDFGAIELSKEENVSIEEVVDTDTVVRLMTNQFEHSEREYGRLLHKTKCQKGMLKKQGKDISKLQKEKKKLNNLLTKLVIKNMNLELENKKLKEQLKKLDEKYKELVWE